MCSLISNKFTPHFICLSEHYTTLQNLSTISLDNYYILSYYYYYFIIFHVLIVLELEYVFSLGQICNIPYVMSLNFVLKKRLKFVLLNLTWEIITIS